LHLALAIAPSVGIYWLTNLYEAGPLVQDKHRAALSARVNCPGCGAENLANRCPHDASFVDDVALEEVIGMAMQPFLDRRGGRSLFLRLCARQCTACAGEQFARMLQD
jgi:hypothetical protein